MSNPDYDKEKFEMDEYGNLIPRVKKNKKKKKTKQNSRYIVPKSRIDSNTFPYLY